MKETYYEIINGANYRFYNGINNRPDHDRFSNIYDRCVSGRELHEKFVANAPVIYQTPRRNAWEMTRRTVIAGWSCPPRIGLHAREFHAIVKAHVGWDDAYKILKH